MEVVVAVRDLRIAEYTRGDPRVVDLRLLCARSGRDGAKWCLSRQRHEGTYARPYDVVGSASAFVRA